MGVTTRDGEGDKDGSTGRKIAYNSYLFSIFENKLHGFDFALIRGKFGTMFRCYL